MLAELKRCGKRAEDTQTNKKAGSHHDLLFNGIDILIVITEIENDNSWSVV